MKNLLAGFNEVASEFSREIELQDSMTGGVANW